MNTLTKISFLLLLQATILRPASDYSSLGNKRYNEVSFPCAHNAQSDKGANIHTIISVQNQEKSIKQQLDAGIRGMKLPIFFQDTTLLACHGINHHVVREVKQTIDDKTKSIPKFLRQGAEELAKLVLPSGFTDIYFKPDKVKPCYIDPGAKKLENIFSDIRTFLEKNPTEIVTLFLEIWLKSKSSAPQAILDIAKKSGVDTYLYAQKDSEPWPLLQDLISSNKRLIIFLDIYVDQSVYPFNQYNTGAVWSSPYAFGSPDDVKKDSPSKGPSLSWHDNQNKSWILQHFVTVRTGGSSSAAEKVNNKKVILDRVERYKKAHNLPNPTFIWVDYFNYPSSNGIFDAIDILNGVKK